MTLGGLVIRAGDAVTVAVGGAVCPGCDWGTAFTLRPGATLRLGTPADGVAQLPRGARRRVAAAELGSRSTDTLSGLGPPALRRGARLDVGAEVAGDVTRRHRGARRDPSAAPDRARPAR